MAALKALLVPALLILSACGGGELDPMTAAPTAPDPPAAVASADPAPATAAGFDWQRWAAVVDQDPCGWLSADDLAALGITGTGVRETTASETRCLWQDAQGAPIFSVGVQTWDSAANLIAERAEQLRLADDMGGFIRVGASAGTVSAVYRRSRGRLSIFPNAADQTAMILINAQKTQRDDPPTKAAKDARAQGYAVRLIESHGL